MMYVQDFGYPGALKVVPTSSTYRDQKKRLTLIDETVAGGDVVLALPVEPPRT